MHRLTFCNLTIAAALLAGPSEAPGLWRAATDSELKQVIPARAPVEKEHIETEFRTASAITDGKGRYVAGVGLITAGYAAEGKYTTFFLTQIPIKIGDLSLEPGEYALGRRTKDKDSLEIIFYDAQSGKLLGSVVAHRLNRTGRVESFRILPPAEKGVIQVGRFGMPYQLPE